MWFNVFDISLWCWLVAMVIEICVRTKCYDLGDDGLYLREKSLLFQLCVLSNSRCDISHSLLHVFQNLFRGFS